MAQQPAATVSETKKLDAIFSAVTDSVSPGLSAIVEKDGRTLLEKGYGLTDLRTKSKITAATNFRLASVSKEFTAMAVMLLVHDNKLRYESTLGEIFPDFAAYGKNITVRQLLNHTSGLPDYETLMDAEEKQKGKTLWTVERQISDEEVLHLLESANAGLFPPGSNWAYSNSGYVTLGVIVAKVSGKPFGEFLQERIFSPLKMNHTLVYIKGQNAVPHRAYGHSRKNGSFVETDQSSTSATQGDGGIYSNIEDLSKWDDALRKNTLLSAAEMEPALTPVKLANGATPIVPEDAPPEMRGKPISYGFGWFLDPYQGHARMWHYGDTMGFKTAIQRFTKDGITIIVLCNRTDLDPGTLALLAFDTLLPRQEPAP